MLPANVGFLADQIFYRSYVCRQHFRLRFFASLFSTVQYFWGHRSFQLRYAAHFFAWFGHDFPARQFASVRSFLIAATTRYSDFFLLSLVTRFACDIGQLAKIWIWASSEVITICIKWVLRISVDQLNTSQLWRDPTRSKQLSTVTIWLSVWTCRCSVKLST